MVRFFERGGEVHPIRNSSGYDPAEERKPGGRERRREKRRQRNVERQEQAEQQRALPTPTKAERKRLDAERKAFLKAQRDAERAAKAKAKRDAQAARAEAMWRKWEAKEEENKAKAEKRKQKQAERDARILEDEEYRERKAMAKQRKQYIRMMIGRGIAPEVPKHPDEEWRTSVPRSLRNIRRGIRADELASMLSDDAPWLGIHNTNDLYEEMDRWQRGIFSGPPANQSRLSTHRGAH